MSEYQYYEFCSINKPLSPEARKEMASLSSRAKITTHSAAYVYNYGDFRGNSKELLLKHFDVFFYISNFGVINLTFKYKNQQINIDELKGYRIKSIISCEQHDNDVLLEMCINKETGFGWTEGEGLLADLLPIYAEIMAKNYKFLRLITAINNEFNGTAPNLLSEIITEIGPLSAAQKFFLDIIDSY